jgi:hypothetical protein
MQSGLVLLGVYVVLVIVGELIGIGISYEVGLHFQRAGEIIVLVTLIGMLIVPWPLAVMIQKRISPDLT